MTKLLLIGLLLGMPSKAHGTITAKTSEGGHQYNDYYLVNISGELYEAEADDLEPGDSVTVYMLKTGYIISTRYGTH